MHERARQDRRWGVQDLDPATWLMVIGEEVGEVNRAVIEHLLGHAPDLRAYREELVQVAAVTVHALESFDRQARAQTLATGVQAADVLGGAVPDADLDRAATRDVVAEVYAERRRQDARWGTQDHVPRVWLMILGEEVGEANQAALEHHFAQFDKRAATRGPRDLAEYRAELVQVAAVAVSMIECLDRQGPPG